jgi:hypothetical protein|tara:strand:- start:77 stop:373 length:297 start_codon:yes stop_codon:yes gene_type:complete
VLKVNRGTTMTQREKGRTFDGISRPADDNYRKNFNRIFKNPVAKEVRTSKFKSQVVEDKTKYNRKKEKTLHEMAMEGYEEEQRMYEDEEYLESLKDKL